MTGEEIIGSFQERFGDSVVDTVADGIHPFVKVKPDVWLEAARHARESLGCETLHDLTAVDNLDAESGPVMTVVVHLWSYSQKHWVTLKADVARDEARIASLNSLWRAADWHERETWDLLGVWFEGHPNMRRILCAEDWVGHPLRKDYKLPEYYHGIPGIPVIRGREFEMGRCFPPREKQIANRAKFEAGEPGDKPAVKSRLPKGYVTPATADGLADPEVAAILGLDKAAPADEEGTPAEAPAPDAGEADSSGEAAS